VNIGGEGEVTGAINVNSLVFPLRTPASIKRAGPLIQGAFRLLPVRSGTLDEVVGNRLPALSGPDATPMCDEAFRVLRADGLVRLHASTGGGAVLMDA
jgi:hypothetical protein